MDRRKKRTSTNQYTMYIDMMEKDTIFATGRVPRDIDTNYLHKKWKELSDKLNTCNSGPTLTAEEWRKRLNDWKNTTRCKYRRSISGEKDISLTSLEMKALELFGKAPNATTEQCISIHLKEEPAEQEHQRSSESLQKELQAAVEEAIGGDDEEEEDDMLEEPEDEHVLPDSIATNTQSTTVGGGSSTTYRAILVENSQFADDDNDHLEFITQRRHTLGPSSSATTTVATGVQTVVTSAPTTATVTKIINGDIPVKRLRSHATEQIIYEVKKPPISTHQHTPRITPINNCATPPNITNHHHQQQQSLPHYPPEATTTFQNVTASGVTSQDARQIALQLKRLADVKTEKLKFEVARFKFNNPGFQFNYPPL